MNVSGVFIGASMFSFTDDKTGELIEGAKLRLAVPSDGKNDVGHSVLELSMPVEAFRASKKDLLNLQFAEVDFECTMKMVGKGVKLTAVRLVV